MPNASRAATLRSTFLGVFALSTLIIAGCSSSTTGVKVTVPSAATLTQQASTNFTADAALHFHLTAKDIVPSAYSVTDAEGDVVRPDKLQATGSDNVSRGLTVAIGIILIGQNQYVDLLGGGHYTKTTGLPDLLAIFDPNKGIGAILQQFKNPSTPTADTINNVPTWKFSGTVSSLLLAPITGSTSTTDTPIQTTLWVGQSDGQIYQVTLVGIAADGDIAQTTRTFTLSKFNETVTISAPAP